MAYQTPKSPDSPDSHVPIVTESELINLIHFEHPVYGGAIEFTSRTLVCDGVERYAFDYIGHEANEKDLAIIVISPESQTPLRQVMRGTATIEGHMSGDGSFYHESGGEFRVDPVGPEPSQFERKVFKGDSMQWTAHVHEPTRLVQPLIVYEICIHPYSEGRFQNLPEEPSTE